MNTNWSTPKKNIIAGMNDLRKCLASGYNARLIRKYNEDCQYPLKKKNEDQDFRNYDFYIGYSSTVNIIKADTSMTEFEKHLSLNYVNKFGTQEAVDRYYKIGICSAENFKGVGRSHLILVDDLIKFFKENDPKYAEMYERQYRSNNNDESHLFCFYKHKVNGSSYAIQKFKHKLWVVEILDKDQSKIKVPILVKVIKILVSPLKYIPKKSVLCMQEYKIITYRIGDITNGLSIQIQIPKKFSFK
jgi:hypothetical protein